MERISKYDLLIAYRKAKVDIYYSSNPDYEKLIDYEKNLNEHLDNLRENINSGTNDWINNDFIGTWTINCKKIDIEDDKDCINTDPNKSWEIYKKKSSIIKSDFRIMEKLSIDFHVLSSLWINKVGIKFDKQLGGYCYGNRIHKDNNGNYNELSSGNISPYLFKFKDWKKNAYTKIKEEIKQRDLIAITSDITSFYHNLSPDFILSDDFLNEINVELDEDEYKLTELLISSIKSWASKTPIEKGLPVGLSASAIIANISLYRLDKLILEDFKAIHYGRYVDDLIIILDNSEGLECSDQVLQNLINKSNNLLKFMQDNSGNLTHDFRFSTDYLNNSNICFSNKKNKVLFLNGKSGEVIIDSIISSMDTQSSEWRELPVIPENIKEIDLEIVSVLNSDGYNASSINQIETFEVKKSKFAVYLKNIETFERELNPEDWLNERQAFISSFIDFIISPTNIFTFELYIPRIIRLSCSCNEQTLLIKLIDKINFVIDEISKYSKVSIINNFFQGQDKDNILLKWKEELNITIRDAIISSSSLELVNILETLKTLPSLNNKAIGEYKADLFNHDLAYRPYKSKAFSKYFPKRLTEDINLPPVSYIWTTKLGRNGKLINLSAPHFRGLRLLKDILGLKTDGLPFGLQFPTRPFSVEDLYLIHNEFFNLVEDEKRPDIEQGNIFRHMQYIREIKHETLDKIVYSLRGFHLDPHFIPKLVKFKDEQILDIPFYSVDTKDKIKIAVVNWKNDSETYYDTIGIANGNNVDKTRTDRLHKLINSITRSGNEIDYLVFPELAISPFMFYSLSRKLKAYKISLISGVDYIKSSTNIVHNQVWSSLLHYGLKYPTFATYMQDKQKPAHGEKKNLASHGYNMKPNIKWKTPPLIKHGKFILSMVICSELTNIQYRSDLRGKIDALFVPEWNRDVNTFNSIVESAAYDIHAYIVQCNNREYGDSRIRGPYKESWEKDIVQVRGGASDFYVIGEIDINRLREYQSGIIDNETPVFKLLPDGFEISQERKIRSTR